MGARLALLCARLSLSDLAGGLVPLWSVSVSKSGRVENDSGASRSGSDTRTSKRSCAALILMWPQPCPRKVQAKRRCWGEITHHTVQLLGLVIALQTTHILQPDARIAR